MLTTMKARNRLTYDVIFLNAGRDCQRHRKYWPAYDAVRRSMHISILPVSLCPWIREGQKTVELAPSVCQCQPKGGRSSRFRR